MPLAEVVAVEIGSIIAKYILKLWLKDASLGSDIASNVIDILRSKTSDMLAQRRGNRQFEIIGEKVGENLLPLFEYEGAHLDEGERIAVAYAVASTFNQSTLSTEIIVKRNLEPAELSEHIFAVYPTATRDFSGAAMEFYRRIINEACTYIVDIASQLPSFTERTFAEVLKREDEILKRVDQVLSELQKRREQLDPMIEAERFEIEYRQAVARNLDILQLIGADVSLPNRRHKLSVAYITLSVEQQPSTVTEANGNIPEEETVQEIVSVNIALARSHRLLIRGIAGSGKTTLLQWIAVRAATKTFEGELSDWNTSLPFYLRLRHYVQSGLPRPEAFPEVAAPLIVGTMPPGWVHAALKSGRALMLVDGVDEVPASQREEVHTWLNDLVATYPRAHFFVTSRPHAIPEGWMNHQSFEAVELQPMELSDIAAFIDHWHAAVREELQTDEEKRELEPLAAHLKEQVRLNWAIRTLATSPLLCAMLCAIHRDRRQHLPVNRVELYRACCLLLLERRDKESRIDLADYPALTLGQKERILQGLAYWMLQANLSEADIVQVDERFSEQLVHMPNLSRDITGTAIRRLLVERAGIIREPVAGQIDFTHRTFEEFFAAQAALDVRDIGRLIADAHDDQWREVIVLAAGLASKALCEQLITGLIKRGDAEEEHRHQLHLLAVSCLETAVELALEVKKEVEKRLYTLIPPKNITDARALASAGDLAIPYLKFSRLLSPNAPAIVACIKSLTLIGGELALEQLEGYTSYKYSNRVADALYQAWDSFDKEVYAQRVLSQMETVRLTSLDNLQYFTSMTSFELIHGDQVSDLSPLASLKQLATLHLSDCKRINNLSPLASLNQLTSLALMNCEQVGDLSPLADLKSLIWLTLRDIKVSDLSPLASLNQLTSLEMSDCGRVRDLSALASLTQLTGIWIRSCNQVSDLSPLASLNQLTSLNLEDCRQISDLSPLANLKQLSSLNLTNCKQVSDLSSLAGLTKLRRLKLSGCERIADLSTLKSLKRLEILR